VNGVERFAVNVVSNLARDNDVKELRLLTDSNWHWIRRIHAL